ncbi:hypothetical protein K435DRAFT_431004 [Dendrothele bispora CBS 962.96]|uniref:F-box domain-containing protein n=1 Tax=Dendrothele bispora (strain CBS 962.96) TaxID=1314807 RepID=A0A4S8MFC1_DENBC|nr:hypothetical protein K435DRAFT_431004 [Dendrothele bispora CBS 962.96]
MEWKKPFNKSVAAFKSKKYEQALKNLNQALQLGGSQQFIVYDSRAAIYEKLGRNKEALLDVKSAIRLAPSRWQSYARAARLFHQVSMWDKALSMVDVALKKIPAEPSPSRSELVALKEELEHSQKQATSHLAQLPVELLTEIFQLLVYDDVVNVVLLARICKHWRAVALNTPSLWSTLVLSKRRPVLKSSLWIQRSQGRILKLVLRETLLLDNGWSFDNLKGLRWDYLRICHLEHVDIEPYLRRSSRLDVLSNLTELSVRDIDILGRDPLLSRLDKPLQHLRLDNAFFQLTSLSNNITSLTSLVLRRAPRQTLDSLYKVLSANLFLEDLTIDYTTFTPFDEIPSVPLVLSHLATFELNGPGLNPDIYQVISFPAVQNVHVHEYFFFEKLLNRLLASDVKELVQLTIASCAISPSALVLLELLSKNSLLETITLNRLAGVASSILDALSSSPRLCPNLKHLDVSYCSEVMTGPLVNLVKSRLPPVVSESASGSVNTAPPFAVKQIEHLAVDGCPHIEPDFVPWFRKQLKYFSCIYQTKREARWKR